MKESLCLSAGHDALDLTGVYSHFSDTGDLLRSETQYALYLEALGYDVSMVEYISPLDTPKNLMMRCVKTRDFNPAAMRRFDDICAALGVDLSIAKAAW